MPAAACTDERTENAGGGEVGADVQHVYLLYPRSMVG